MKIDWHDPRNIIIVIGGLLLSLTMISKLGEGLDYTRKLLGTVEVAYAGYDKSIKVESDLDRYIAAQEQVLVEQRAYTKAQQEFNKSLVEIQKQQPQTLPAPVPPAPVSPETVRPAVWIEPEPIDGRWVCADGVQRWWYDEATGCE